VPTTSLLRSTRSVGALSTATRERLLLDGERVFAVRDSSLHEPGLHFRREAPQAVDICHHLFQLLGNSIACFGTDQLGALSVRAVKQLGAEKPLRGARNHGWYLTGRTAVLGRPAPPAGSWGTGFGRRKVVLELLEERRRGVGHSSNQLPQLAVTLVGR
jgi:hypothetical protein